MKRLLEFLFLAVVLISGAKAETPAEALQQSKGRILILGDSITWKGGWVSDFITWGETGPRKGMGTVWLNLGLPSENVSGLSEPDHAGGRFPRPDLHERLQRVIDSVKPDLIFACYGMNDGILLPFDRERAEKYAAGQGKLKAAAESAGAKIVFLTPPYFDGMKVPAQTHYTEVLGRYSKWLLNQRKKGWMVIDINGPMTEEIEKTRRKNPAYSVQPDGVHPDGAGHWMMAKAVIEGCGGRKAANAPDLADYLHQEGYGPELRHLIDQRMTILRDAWLARTGHKRPGMAAGLPFEEAEARATNLTHQIDTLIMKKK